MTKMLRKIITIVLVSFFIMTGLAVLNQGNQNYNISGNNIINNFTIDSTKILNFSLNDSITYSEGISSAGQTFGCFNQSLYYINGDSIYDLNVKDNKISSFLSLSSQPRQIEIYDNYMIIGYGSGATSVASTLFNVYNFYNNHLYFFNMSISYNYLQFIISDNNMYISGIESHYIVNYNIALSSNSITCLNVNDIPSVVNQFAIASYNSNIIFAINSNGVVHSGYTTYNLCDFGYYNMQNKTIDTSINNYYNSSDNTRFGNIYGIIDLGNIGLLGSESYYITNKNTGGTTAYSCNAYSNTLYFADSNYKNSFIPINLTNNAFTQLSYNSNIQDFYYDNNITQIYLPIGAGNTVFNTLTYIINGNKNLYIINNNEVFIYEYSHNYNLNVKSYNLDNNQIQNYFLFDGIIYSNYSNNFIINKFPIIITPLNTTYYFYNSSSITITQSNFTGTGTNLYYNLSIYYGFGNVQSTITSNSLYLIILYVVIGLGLAIFVIASVRYRI